MMREDRIHVIGDSPYEHEREAIQFLQEALPASEPYRLWALFELLERNNGALYEVDALVLGFQALYLVEIKSHPGTLSGDDVDWAWRPHEDPERTVWLRNPLATTNLKCKVLASQLKRFFPEQLRVPRVEPLVFLSAEPSKLKLRFSERGAVRVVTRDTVVRAITHHDFPGAAPTLAARINTPVAQALEAALAKLGVRPRRRRMTAGQYELGAIVDTGPGFQDRTASHLALGDKRAVIARTFLVSQQVTDERRRKLLAAAKREFSLLLDLGTHPGIVKPIDFVADAELGPTLLFEDYRSYRPLSQLLRTDGEARAGEGATDPLSFDECAAIAVKLARILAFCHRRGVCHGALSPDAVLVERRVHAEPEVRLRNFFLGASADVSGTVLSTQLLASSWQLYQAPEAVRGAEPSEATDVFSLGALTYHLLVGRPAAPTVIEQLRLLQASACLDITLASDSIQDELSQVVRDATQLSPIDRHVTAEQFANRLEEFLTRPEPVTALTLREELDPLEARKGDLIAERYRVDGVRGQGASARVLQVRDEQTGKALALKIQLDGQNEEHLEAEAELLRELDHTRIVRFDRVFTTAGRRCLTMTLAGTDTLADQLRESGPPALDYAQRYGDELLDALRYLECDVQRLHRDIKPANVGVGALNKQATHLTLFDFSLASAPLDALTVGTAAYRDPLLEQRGRWDFAADRYAAAVTLYELITGRRPEHYDVTRPVVIDADRFDPSVKDGLTHFFKTALERDVEARYPSAEDMRRQWTSAFDARVNQHLAAGRRREVEPLDPTQSELVVDRKVHLAGLSADASVDELGLSASARSALSRAGVFRAGELLALPNNRLSAMRGVGRAVSEEILEVRDAWAAIRPRELPTEACFAPEYAGEAYSVESPELGLSERAALALQDAGIADARTLAAAPTSQVTLLLERAQEPAHALRQRLAAQTRSAASEGHSLVSLVESFLGGKAKAAQQLRVWWGLSAPFAGRTDVTAIEAAQALDVRPAVLHAALGQLASRWAEAPHRDLLVQRVLRIAGELERAAPLERSADALAVELGTPVETAESDAPGAHALLRAQAAALVRVVVELQSDDEDDGLRLLRAPGDGAYWLVDQDDSLDLLRALGRRADLVANRVPLASPTAALKELRAVFPARPLAGAEAAPRLAELSDVRLLQLACAWSETAALSARLELYPRALDPARALELCVAALDGDVGIEDLQRRVTGRFGTVTLPEGDALDALLEAQGFEWSSAQSRYVRQSAGGASDPGTRIHPTASDPHRGPASVPIETLTAAEEARSGSDAATGAVGSARPASQLPPVRRVSDFERSLRSVVERGGLRVVTVSAKSLREAELALARRLGTEAVALDAALSREIHEAEPTQTDVIYEIDSLGRDHPEWCDLTDVAKAAAQRVVERVCREPGVKLLSRPGLCARYDLTDLLTRLRAFAEGDQRSTVILLVPTVGPASGVPRIEDSYPISGLTPQHVLRLHRQDLSALGAA